ncbi:hypothetical protein ACFXA3_18345 [Streptomyces sp. NPDC059456]|uniref:hypothetical protein n=1 Tax=Streptomyces sp. NPDC059456 TaxID=3346838 RepID=UPI003682E075
MGWTFKLHAAVAGGLSALMVAVAAVTALPGITAVPGAHGLALVGIACVFPLFLAGQVRLLRARCTKATAWLALLCLPVAVRAALVVLVGGGFALSFLSIAFSADLQEPEVRDGHYYAFDTSRGVRTTVEVSRGRYESALAAEQLVMLAGPAAFLAVAAGAALVAGELGRSPVAVGGGAPRRAGGGGETPPYVQA